MVDNEKGSILKTIGIVVYIFIAILFVALIGSSNNDINENNLLNKIEEDNIIGENQIQGNNIVTENKIEENVSSEKNENKIDYENVTSFETDLNNGVDVNGKVVKFVVIKYAPDSLLGYNSHAGEHLNFISKNDLKLNSNDVVVAKVISTSKFLGSWMIEFEEVEIIKNEIENTEKVENAEKVESEKIETTDKVENTEKVEKIEKIKVPMSSTSAWKSDYKEVEKEFKDVGFINVTLKKIEDAKPNGFWVKAGQVEKVYICGDDFFYSDDEFDKNAEVVIEYHTYPSVKYTKVSAKTLINALEKNAASAKEKYLDEYLEISGVVRNIDADLDYITISYNSTEWDTIQCYINNKDTEKKVKKISKGDKIVVRGQISSVGEVLGYSLYITEIVK